MFDSSTTVWYFLVSPSLTRSNMFVFFIEWGNAICTTDWPPRAAPFVLGLWISIVFLNLIFTKIVSSTFSLIPFCCRSCWLKCLKDWSTALTRSLSIFYRSFIMVYFWIFWYLLLGWISETKNASVRTAPILFKPIFVFCFARAFSVDLDSSFLRDLSISSLYFCVKI